MRPRYVTTREEHIGLRGGEGLVTTYTKVLKKWILFGGPSPKKRVIKLVLSSGAWIGRHQHTDDSEIYITFNRDVTFNGKRYWCPINICRKGERHSAANNSRKDATIYAFKFWLTHGQRFLLKAGSLFFFCLQKLLKYIKANI